MCAVPTTPPWLQRAGRVGRQQGREAHGGEARAEEWLSRLERRRTAPGLRSAMNLQQALLAVMAATPCKAPGTTQIGPPGNCPVNLR